jgi:hypothetical protein
VLQAQIINWLLWLHQLAAVLQSAAGCVSCIREHRFLVWFSCSVLIFGAQQGLWCFLSRASHLVGIAAFSTVWQCSCLDGNVRYCFALGAFLYSLGLAAAWSSSLAHLLRCCVFAAH